jgi:hypothetical protein
MTPKNRLQCAPNEVEPELFHKLTALEIGGRPSGGVTWNGCIIAVPNVSGSVEIDILSEVTRDAIVVHG